MQTVLITGANRGLGLEFVKQYAEADCKVVACCRNPATADALKRLARSFPSIQIETLDVADFAQIDVLSRRLADARIDVLINNAGVYGDSAEHGFGALDFQTWTATLRVNALAPVKMAEALLPQLERGDKKLIVAISSLMGSITDNTGGGSIVYRSSKAALNAAMKSLAIDLSPRALGVLIFHPGWVKTDMGGKNALIDADESVTGMRRVIAAFTSAQSGAFVKYDGSLLPW
ncbi:MAG: short-chain dehydrogenase [Gammaproteobacteria bacterium HGW-Gammaproteobacteria-3]|nr:MAG: short-chain dehydrogenase [Gammaproteobacteria bacterium HGW-Gammaproteobacteria-3]